jgi:hypothetical protein
MAHSTTNFQTRILAQRNQQLLNLDHTFSTTPKNNFTRDYILITLIFLVSPMRESSQDDM